MLPEAFLNRIKAQLGEEYDQYLHSLERPRAVALRFNPLKGERPRLPFAGDNVPWEEQGFYYDSESRPGLHPYHEAGVYYLQEASAMSAVALLNPQPGERVLDLCAAPGGKSTQIAGRMMGRGFLLCNEYSPKRAKILSRNIERMGVANALVTNETPEALAKRLPGYFHRVLIDAPCSGEGMFRKEEAAVTDWSEDTVAMCAQRQHEILTHGARLVAPGGRLVYSTCTFAPAENEEAVAAFLAENPDFSLVDAAAPWFSRVGAGQFRLWPHKLLGEGHFVAVMERKAGEETDISVQSGEKLPKVLEAFAKEMGIVLPEGKAVSFGDTWYWAPEALPRLQGLRVLRPGLELGQLRKDRFEPAHALALWLKTCENCYDIDPEGEQIAQYLHGEVLPAHQRGWCLVRVGGYSIGWGKADGKQLKNHYPKGLRR